MALADIFSSNEFIQRKFCTECIKDFIHSGLMGKIIWGKIVFWRRFPLKAKNKYAGTMASIFANCLISIVNFDNVFVKYTPT